MVLRRRTLMSLVRLPRLRLLRPISRSTRISITSSLTAPKSLSNRSIPLPLHELRMHERLMVVQNGAIRATHHLALPTKPTVDLPQHNLTLQWWTRMDNFSPALCRWVWVSRKGQRWNTQLTALHPHRITERCRRPVSFRWIRRHATVSVCSKTDICLHKWWHVRSSKMTAPTPSPLSLWWRNRTISTPVSMACSRKALTDALVMDRQATVTGTWIGTDQSRLNSSRITMSILSLRSAISPSVVDGLVHPIQNRSSWRPQRPTTWKISSRHNSLTRNLTTRIRRCKSAMEVTMEVAASRMLPSNRWWHAVVSMWTIRHGNLCMFSSMVLIMPCSTCVSLTISIMPMPTMASTRTRWISLKFVQTQVMCRWKELKKALTTCWSWARMRMTRRHMRRLRRCLTLMNSSTTWQ